MIDYLTSLGIKVDVSARYDDSFDNKLEEFVSYLREIQTISSRDKKYPFIKSMSMSYANGTLSEYRISRLKEYGFILEDGSFCTYSNGRIYKNISKKQ